MRFDDVVVMWVIFTFVESTLIIENVLTFIDCLQD